MAASKKLTTTVSVRGQMVLPKAVRERHGWGPGVRLVVEDRPEGVLLRREREKPLFPPTRLEDVVGMLKYEGPPITIEEMKEAVLQEAAARWERFERTGTDYEDDEDGDTNVLVRLITADEPEQVARARRLFSAGRIYIPVTVLLETEWVLRRRLRMPRDRVLASLGALCGTEGVSVETAERVALAFGWAERGMDFADALHLAASEECEAVATFDRDFVTAARRLGAAPPVVEP